MSAPIGRVFPVTVTTALYRRYRPDSFADVIGQEHVTEPLMTALRKNRVNHAYLFSGPRGCGKTTSARILARCLNCAKGPTDTPCGVCPSCVELARGGAGSLDVIEIDAASHGGVDDARDLRERATYAPVRDRYKIFIIDEAHMVTSAGFNALLKIVEEPPEHIKFIFATTEPDKVIGTIRSRTHHYPFRLVPPEPLLAYLELLCNQENVPVAPGVLSLVIRAGAGSVRDSLSVLDQLMAGAGPNGLDYELAVALLGYTHASLLDDVVEAIAASDSATVFRAVDRVIQTGHDPRRFVEDLLERFRDLIIVQAMPESAQSILRGMPADQIARMQSQSHNLGAAELSRAADVTNTALTEMTGATSPRLHLELLCARILLPSSEQTERGIAARIDRLERRLNYAGNEPGVPTATPVSAAPVPPAPVPTAPAAAPAAAASDLPSAAAAASAVDSAPPPAPSPAGAAHGAPAPATGMPDTGPSGPAAQLPAQREPISAPRISTTDWPVDEPHSGPRRPSADAVRTGGPESTPPVQPAPVQPAPVQPAPVRPTPAQDARPVPAPAAAGAPRPAPPTSPGGGADVEMLRRAWPEILQTLTKIKRSTWALVEPNAQVGQFDGQVLTLVFTTPGLAGAFGRADHSENLRQAIHKTIGIDCQITATAGGSNSAASSEPNPKGPISRDIPATTTDADWGLAPAGPDTGQAPAHRQEQAPAPQAPAPRAAAPQSAAPQTTSPQVPVTPAAPGQTVNTATRSGRPGQPSVMTPGPGRDRNADIQRATPSVGAPLGPSAPLQSGDPGQPADPWQPADAGQTHSYSYPDDDWGPPLDEDAPPLDEEPPADWEPPSPREPRSEPSPAAASGPAAQAAGPVQPAAPAQTAAPARGPARQVGDASSDPWSRAVEQAPGVWALGSETNVGKYLSQPGDQGGQEPPAPAAPRYEPAAAQVPPSAQPRVPDPAGTSRPSQVQAGEHTHRPLPGGPATPEPGTAEFAPAYAMASAPAAGSDAAGFALGAAPSAKPQLAPTRVTALGSAPAGAPGATQGTAAVAAPSPAGNGKLSLYQRLSNSPEAEAGRAKAPARQAEPTASYAQDIPSADDETIEESGVFGRAAVERILGGKLIEERSLDGSPLLPR
ncbi:DNA polymerase III subunit gamma and tau [Arthrobacter sp. NPDC093139]|uniref:DNA polymerase III subunit gamma and tau n=1 Tax=Arthrobacter sp. NPDC093139 TaxID=3363945 RepID=UPI0037F8A181